MEIQEITVNHVGGTFSSTVLSDLRTLSYCKPSRRSPFTFSSLGLHPPCTSSIPSLLRSGTPPSATCSRFFTPSRLRYEAASVLLIPPEQATASGLPSALLRISSGTPSRSCQ